MSDRRRGPKDEPTSEFDPCSLDWENEQEELIHEMLGSVRGVDADGGDVEIDPGQFTVHDCAWGDSNIPVIMFGERPMYFFRAYAFHPGAVPVVAQTPGVVEALQPARTGRAFVVDTGWPSGQAPTTRPNDVDPCTIDAVYGHGPAIVGFIRDLAPRAQVHLRAVGLAGTQVKDTQGNPAIPIFEHSGVLFRGFDEDALMSTLLALETELVLGDVVNLSLGAVACPDMMLKGLVGLWAQRVGAEGVKVVVAAGNHATRAPSWPAAYATGVNSIDGIPNVYSVGSGNSQASRSSFSAHGSWVTTWRNGANVSVDHPDANKFGTSKPNATWSGTSFAAPIYAAELLPHLDPRNQGSDAGGIATGGATPVLPDRTKPVQKADQRDIRFGGR